MHTFRENSFFWVVFFPFHISDIKEYKSQTLLDGKLEWTIPPPNKKNELNMNTYRCQYFLPSKYLDQPPL